MAKLVRCVLFVVVVSSRFLLAQTDEHEMPPGCPAKSLTEATRASQQAVLGMAAYRRQDLTQAVAAFNRAIEIDACNALAHYYAWRFSALAGKTVEARRQLDLAHQLSDLNPMRRTWNAVQQAVLMEAAVDAPRLTSVRRSESSFFSKTVDCDGIPVRSAISIDTDALFLACGRIRTMLRHTPSARSRLIAKGAELHIIGEFQVTTDLPENAQYRNTTYIDAEGQKTNMAVRTRGVGGLLSSCGEENLLHLPDDRYGDGSDTCFHEFAHDFMENGLSEKERSAIEKQYRAATKLGLWKSAYASVNAKEYWAELSMWYFGAHGNYVPEPSISCETFSCTNHDPTGPGPDALRAYDPGGFALLDRLYQQ